MVRILQPASAFLAFGASRAHAHAAEQGFVLLLPTKLYISTGIAAVVLTIAVLALAPSHLSRRMFVTLKLPQVGCPQFLRTASSLASLVVLALLVVLGFTGPGDPLTNPLPLAVWTVWWIVIVFLQGVVGDIWSFVNPWTGLHRVLTGGKSSGRLAPPPPWVGHGIGILFLLIFHIVSLADPAPDNPPRLAGFVAAYWLVTMAGMLLCGREAWLERSECFTMLFRLVGSLSPLRLARGGSEVGLPGWQLVRLECVPAGLALFVLIALGTGSFDGLNETFWWLALIGVNPLEFPGRSAVIGETVAGIMAASLLLILVFSACTWIGIRIAGAGHGDATGFGTAFRRLSISVLPIAFGYHAAHYLTAFMVNIQYAAAAANDPLGTGADLLGLGHFYVTTGFFNTRESVRIIWLTQCFAVVAGHVIAVMVAHEIARRIFPTGRQALLSQIPMSVFMILYTLLSLWLLASPRGA